MTWGPVKKKNTTTNTDEIKTANPVNVNGLGSMIGQRLASVLPKRSH